MLKRKRAKYGGKTTQESLKKREKIIPCKICGTETKADIKALSVICSLCVLTKPLEVSRISSGGVQKKFSCAKDYLIQDQEMWSEKDHKKISNFNKKIKLKKKKRR